MKARLLLLLSLVAANVGYFAWGQDWLRPWGLPFAGPGEPQRLAQQIRPEALRILGSGNGGSGDDTAAAPATRPAPAPAGAASAPATTAELPQQPAASAAATP